MNWPIHRDPEPVPVRHRHGPMSLGRVSRLLSTALLLLAAACGTVPEAPSPTLATETRPQANSGLTAEEIDRLLAEHNRVRAEVGVPPLAWSDRLAAYAGQWARHLAEENCELAHRPPTGSWSGPFGENLFMGTAGYYGVGDAVRGWEREKRHYRGKELTPSNWRPIAHYTQMVWRGTREVGCARALCRGRLIVVCNYDPPGNVLGEKPY